MRMFLLKDGGVMDSVTTSQTVFAGCKETHEHSSMTMSAVKTSSPAQSSIHYHVYNLIERGLGSVRMRHR